MIIANPTIPKKILLVVENSPDLGAVIKMINQIRWPAGSSVFLLVVVPEQLPLMDTCFEARSQVDETAEINRWRGWAATKLMADQISAKLQAPGLIIEKTEICAGALLDLALEHALNISPDLIVLGAQSVSEPENIPLSPSTGKLAENTSQSVLVVRPSKPVYPLHTILAVDNSPEAWHAIKFVRSLSLPNWARITLLYVSGEAEAPSIDSTRGPVTPSTDTKPLHLPPAIAEHFASEAISYMHDCGVAVRWLQRRGHPTHELLAVAQEQEANLIVIGAKSGISISPIPQPGITQNIVKHAPCSVLLVQRN